MNKIFYVIIFGLLCCFQAAMADNPPPPPQPLTPMEFVDRMEQLYQYDRKELIQLFQKTEYNPEVIHRVTKPFEEKPWDFYKNFFITPDRIAGGVQYWHDHAATLEKASRQYGVSPAVIVAIIGIETKYGQEPGKFPELSTLATLSFRYPKRAAFFQKELENYLLLTRDYKLSPTSLYGSYAGALGIPQFMPSNYRQYAVSYDGKPSVNLLEDHDDAIASIAYYLQRSGWDAHQPVASPLKNSQKVRGWLISKDAKPVFHLKTFEKFGLRASTRESPHIKSALIALRNTDGNEYWITFQNFYAIMAYNPRTTYAMAIYQLSEAIKKGYGQGSNQTSPGISKAW
jgi:membrane-bound lytic murein transglycosylase B